MVAAVVTVVSGQYCQRTEDIALAQGSGRPCDGHARPDVLVDHRRGHRVEEAFDLEGLGLGAFQLAHRVCGATGAGRQLQGLAVSPVHHPGEPAPGPG